MYPFMPLAMGSVLPLMFFYKDGFGITWAMTVDEPLNEETNHGKSLVRASQTIVEFLWLKNLIRDKCKLQQTRIEFDGTPIN